MTRLIINTGDVYGKLTIIKEIESIKTARSSLKRMFLCQCECGKISTPSLSGLKSGNTTSCGCNTLNKFKERVTKHKLSTHRLYDTWRSMMSRCNNPKNTNYKYYGGRGIKVCDEWENVETFIHDMDDSYELNLTLDRINNNKGYSKYNCKWSTMEEQSHNKSSNRIVTYKNKEYTMKQLSNKLNLDYNSLKRNLNNGFSIEESIIKSTKQENTMSTERKGLPLELSRKADGIVKRLNPKHVVLALLFRSKKDFAMEFLMNGTINDEAPSTHQIVAALYNGFEYQYGPADARQTMVLPANPTMIEELAEQVPESETNLPTKSATPKVAVKNALVESARKMLAAGLSLDQIKTFLGLTDEDIATLEEE